MGMKSRSFQKRGGTCDSGADTEDGRLRPLVLTPLLTGGVTLGKLLDSVLQLLGCAALSWPSHMLFPLHEALSPQFFSGLLPTVVLNKYVGND